MSSSRQRSVWTVDRGAAALLLAVLCLLLQQVLVPLHLVLHDHVGFSEEGSGVGHTHAAHSHGHGHADSAHAAGDDHVPHPASDHLEDFEDPVLTAWGWTGAMAVLQESDGSYEADGARVERLRWVERAPRAPPDRRGAPPRAPPVAV